MNWPLKVLRAVAISVIILYVAICALLWTFQRHMIFVPSHIVELTPRDFGAQFEPVSVREDSGETLRGWWIPAASNGCAVVYLHGNGGNIGDNAEHGVRLARLGCSVLLLEYRGYGESDGKFPSESSVYKDAQASWDYTISRGYKASQVVIYGHSLGGAIAIELARHHPEAKELIVESGFTSVADMANSNRTYRLFPIPWLLTERFDSIHKVPQLHLPVLFIHGTADQVVPTFMGERLYAAANQPKRLILIPGGHHEDSAKIGGELYSVPVSAFLKTGEIALNARD